MKELSKRVANLETQNELSYEVLSKLHQPIILKILKQVAHRNHYGEENPAYELTKREEKICELHEKAVRADSALYGTSIYRCFDVAKEKQDI